MGVSNNKLPCFAWYVLYSKNAKSILEIVNGISGKH